MTRETMMKTLCELRNCYITRIAAMPNSPYKDEDILNRDALTKAINELALERHDPQRVV